MIRYFDIFAGIGGFRSGLEKAGGFKCVGYCEINKYAKLAFVVHFLGIAIMKHYNKILFASVY